MTLPGPSRTIVVEPVERPDAQPAPAAPEPQPAAPPAPAPPREEPAPA
ncbi:MAG TPA: hypothetical protein VD931_07925 [Baekduia sp.]|nr:hypothetical protein [Baekduia sp.]